MPRVRTSFGFRVLLALAAVLALAELGWAGERRWRANQAEKLIAQRSRQLAALRATKPTPTPENADRIIAARQQAEAALADFRRALFVENSFPRTPSLSRAEAFFELSRLNDELRAKAALAGVALKADERFGFSAYANTGPEPELISAVLKQRLIAQRLLECVLTAQPRRLEAVQRERLGASGKSRDETSGDFFTVDPRLSVRRAGMIETLAFRVVFTGQTSALRRVLNELAHAELALFVRTVEVNLAAREPSPSDSPAHLAQIFGSAAPTNPSRQIVGETFSTFTLVVEFAEPTATSATVATR